MKYIFKSFNFGIITHRDAETMLNGMASKGYEFKRMCKGYWNGFALFEQNEKAKTFKYAVDARCGLQEEEAKELYAFYQDMGWESVDVHRKKLHIFVSKDNHAAPLYTDEMSKYEGLEEAMRQDAEPFGNIALALFCGLVAWVLIKMGGLFGNRLFHYTCFVVCVTIALPCAISAVDSFFYRASCKRAITRGEKIPENLLRREMSKWSSVVNAVVFVMAPLLEVCGCIYLLWGNGAKLLGTAEESMFMAMMCWSGLSIPLALWSNYKSSLSPENKYWKRGSLVVGFLYYLNIYSFINIYLRILP